MAIETERKFLVKDRSIVTLLEAMRHDKSEIKQGYLASGATTVRVRVYNGTESWLTLKGPSENGSCLELEYQVPLEDANQLMSLSGVSKIEKTRYKIPVGKFVGELDVYHGQLQGFMTLEIELEDINTDVPLPFWVGEEVTGQRKYNNDMLAKSYYDPIESEIVGELDQKLKMYVQWRDSSDGRAAD